MNDAFDSHRSIIDAWPDLSAFAADAGVSYGAAKAMRRRNRIVHEYVSNIVRGAQARGIAGVTADRIAELVARPVEEGASS
jgi:hypothetical protein